MFYLLLSIISIIFYVEILPTISVFFELIRTWLAAKITIIQQNTLYIQEEIQKSQERMEQQNTNVIGFEVGE